MVSLNTVRSSCALYAFNTNIQERNINNRVSKVFLCVHKEKGNAYLSHSTIDKLPLLDRIKMIFGFGNASIKAISEFLKSETFQKQLISSDNQDEMVKGIKAFNKKAKYAKYKIPVTDFKLIQSQVQSLKEKITDFGTEGLFRISGRANNVKEIVSAIRNGKKLQNSNYSQHEYACALKQIIREMSPKLFDVFNDKLINEIDETNIRSLDYLIYKLSDEKKQLLRELLLLLYIVKQNPDNNMGAENLSICFAPNLRTSDMSTLGKFNKIIAAMIENYPQLEF